jgi:agmatine deiminase
MFDRRHVIKVGAMVATPLVLGLPACSSDDADGVSTEADSVPPSPPSGPAKPTPSGNVKLADYEMPPEDAPHERTFMQWPNSLDVYERGQIGQVQVTISQIAKVIARYEPVVVLAGGAQTAIAQAALGTEVDVWDIPTEDLWCRDAGPTFVKNDKGDLAIAHISFNGWGNKQKFTNDGQITPRIAARLGIPLLDTGLFGEQGGVEHDGNGLVLAHASSWVNTNRNRGTQNEIGDKLLAALGGEKMIWAPGVKGKDITDYHIDALARFVAPGHVLIQLPKVVDRADPWSVSAFETYEILQNATDVEGRKLKIDTLPEPVDIRSNSDDFIASYVNYYVCNGAVIGAQFGDSAADGRARDMLSSLYPGREIVMLNVDPLGEFGGGIHCATQQQPKSGIL